MASPFTVILAMTIAVSIRTLLVAPFRMPANSMAPALEQGDRVLVEKLTYRFRAPRRWEVAVFQYPPEPRRVFMKRVVGLPGESLELRAGAILIDGAALKLPPEVATHHWLNAEPYGEPSHAFRIPAECYFVLGDTSTASLDSRYWGCVPRSHFIGRAVYRFWPAERMGEIR